LIFGVWSPPANLPDSTEIVDVKGVKHTVEEWRSAAIAALTTETAAE
jgi:hypothetical protein